MACHGVYLIQWGFQRGATECSPFGQARGFIPRARSPIEDREARSQDLTSLSKKSKEERDELKIDPSEGLR